MEQKQINETLRRNVGVLSEHTADEIRMMPTSTETPLPSVEDVKQIVSLIKSIIFPDYFNKRQPDEQLRAYQIGVSMERLYQLLRQQIARGLQFCE
jgi:serine O-acetyltransferase